MSTNTSSGADNTDTSDVNIAYVGGWGRSGSTLLTRMLAEVPGFTAVGELRDVFLRGIIQDRVCGCGTAVGTSCPSLISKNYDSAQISRGMSRPC